VPPEKLPDTLAQIIARHKETLERLAALNSDDPEVKAKVEEAEAAVKVGDYDRANRLLSAAEDADLAAIRMAEDLERQAHGAADTRRLNAAATRATRGDINLTRLDYLAAAGDFKAAADLLPPSAFDKRGDYLNRYGTALYRYGDEKGDNTALLQAIGVFKKALNEPLRERLPLQWAMTQNNLGAALWTLGQRESSTARLEEAVAALRAALQEWTRERVPLQWAMTQNNLGAALQTLGERESSTARLEEAVAAYRAALQEWTRERVPLQWAGTQNNLGVVLQTLGEREGGTARLEEAVAAYRAALQEWTRKRVPLDWALAQNNLGAALRALGERERQPQLLRDALEAVSRAAEVYKDAGIVQHETDFADWISALKAEITAMETARLP
jgi:tetratricopeptide (TPR) repeat protein